MIIEALIYKHFSLDPTVTLASRLEPIMLMYIFFCLASSIGRVSVFIIWRPPVQLPAPPQNFVGCVFEQETLQIVPLPTQVYNWAPLRARGQSTEATCGAMCKRATYISVTAKGKWKVGRECPGHYGRL